jgi:class 3 adenylate cyclase
MNVPILGDYDIIVVDGHADFITIFFASSECDGDQEGVPNAECCLEGSEWNRTMCKSCPFGTYGVGSGVNAKCISCPTDECSVLGLNMIPITCGGLTGCVNVEGSLAECSCPTDSNLDYETDTCAPCTTGQVRPDIDQLRGIDTLGDYAKWEEVQGTCSKQKNPPFWTIFSVLSVCIVIIVGLTMLVWRQRRVIKYHTRDVNNAPRNGTIAIVFTDIEGSTALWEISKTTMSKALDVHHNTIRKVIDKHKGYEVKTIGDSFMIALDSADKAVCLANDIQEELLIADWPVELADMPWAGSEFHCSSGYKGPPKPLYRGLRVRIGIHIGKHSDSAEEGGNMQTKYDNVAKGYDYYGGAVNAASRIEQLAFGGQTLISSDVMGELSDGVKDKCSIHVVGAVQLRGIRQDVFIHQVLPRTLEGRTFRGVFRKSIVDDNISSSSEHSNDFLVVRRSSILTGGSFLENEDLTRDVATLTPVELQATVVRLRNRIFVLQDEFSTHSRRGSSMTDAINESDIDFSVNDEQQIQTSDPDSGDGDDRVALEVMDVIRKIYHENSQSTVQKVANGVRNVDSD